MVDINRKNISTYTWAIVMVAQFLFFFILSKIKGAVELFSQFYEWKKNFHTQLLSSVDVSIGDCIYLILIVWLLYAISRIKKSGKAIINQLLIGLNIFYFAYQCLWGMLYFQEPLINKLGKSKVTQEQLQSLAKTYLARCKESRKSVKENHNGVFTLSNQNQLIKDLLNAQVLIDIKINQKKALKHRSVKHSLFGKWMNYTGILGYFNPFTSEAQYNANLPATQIPFILGHEMAHQMGYAREQEASFIAYLIYKKIDNKDFRYAMEWYVLKSCLRKIQDEKFVENIKNHFSEQMTKDWEHEMAFFHQNDTPLTDFFGFTNDLFLKTNQQEGRITYNYFLNLVARYELK